MTVFTHRRPTDTIGGAARARRRGRAGRGDAAARRGGDAQARPDRRAGPRAERARRRTTSSCAWCSAATARSSRAAAYAGTSVPVFAVNFGEIGFLATVEPRRTSSDGIRRALSGDFELLRLPAIVLDGPAEDGVARAGARRRRSTTWRSTARSASGSPRSPTRWTARRSAACAATAWWSPRRRARPATTSPTAAR